MNHIQTFAQLLRIKGFFQRVNQLSWAIQQFHNKFPKPENMTEKDHATLLNGYRGFYEEIKTIYEDLKNEYEPDTK